MVRINTSVGELAFPGEEYGTLEPNELFRLVAGTSTGGLISIMLGKLGMTVEECIKKYHELSKKIFKKKRFRGGLTHGLSHAKYSGKTLRQCVSDLIHEKGFDREIKMKCDEIHDAMAWSVSAECVQPRNVLTDLY
jgi:patatin-like phospholipase/acyl hydrolase